jgi:hypothetical protein
MSDPVKARAHPGITATSAFDRALNKPSATPQATVEAIMVAVRERGLAALRCDQAARAQINRRIARLIEHKGS